jgi:hypothetical protein
MDYRQLEMLTKRSTVVIVEICSGDTRMYVDADPAPGIRRF